MYSALVRGTLLAARHRELARRIALFEEDPSRAEIERFQVRRFNEIWEYCLAEVPFYRSWRREHGLPERICRPADLRDFPLIDKDVLIRRGDEIFQGGRLTDAYSTGGSTGQPTRYPRGPAEATNRWVDNYLGRHWSGIRPLDPQVLLWGHAHLFGSGLSGRLAQGRRRVADRLANITRLNAYDVSEAALHAHYEALRRANPVCLVGYTSAVFKLARHVERNGLRLGDRSRLRAVVLCAETASDADIALVEKVFAAPAVIEYGAAETGVMAMSCGGTRWIRVIWDSHLCLVSASGALTVSSLAPRLFPLINYAIGDRVEPADVVDGNALAFHAVLGRQQDVVRVSSDSGILDLSAILPVHILKSYPGIIGVQFRQEQPGLLRIHLQADRALDLADVTSFFVRELRKDHPGLDPGSVIVDQVAEQATTVAGKHALFLP